MWPGFCLPFGAEKTKVRRQRGFLHGASMCKASLPGDHAALFNPSELWSTVRALSRERKATELRDLVNSLSQVDAGRYRDLKLHMTVLKAFLSRQNIDGALQHFEDMKIHGLRPDTRTYNYLLGVLARRRRLRQVFELFREMALFNVPADAYTYAAIIEGYAKVGNERMAWSIYDDMRFQHIVPNDVVFGALAAASARAGDLKSAQRALRHMQSYELCPNAHVYNSILAACVKVRDVHSAVETYVEMQRARIVPDRVTFTTLLSAYASVDDLDGVMTTYQEFALRNLQPDAIMYTELIRAQARLGSIHRATAFFEEMPRQGIRRDLITYSTMIDAYGRHRMLQQANETFATMVESGIRANDVVFNTLIDLHTKCADFDGAIRAFRGMEADRIRPTAWTLTTLIHAHMQKFDMVGAEAAFTKLLAMDIRPKAVTYTTLIDGFTKAGDLRKAHYYYEHLKRNLATFRIRLNTRVYNSIMRTYAKFGLPKRIYRQFVDMRHRGVAPDEYTYGLLIDAFASLGRLRAVDKVFNYVVRRHVLEATDRVHAARLRAYAQNGAHATARRLFDAQPRKSTALYLAILSLCLQHRDLEGVDVYCREMQETGFGPSVHVFNVLIEARLLAGDRARALAEMERMRAAGVAPNVHSLDVLLRAGVEFASVVAAIGADAVDGDVCGRLMKRCARRSQLAETLVLERWREERRLAPTLESSWALLLVHDGLKQSRMLRSVFEDMGQWQGARNVPAFNYVIEACGRADDLQGSLELFATMKGEGLEPNLATFNAIMTAYAQRGATEAVRGVMREAERLGFTPDASSYNRLILAHVQNGEPSRAMGELERMRSCGILPDASSFNALISAHLHLGKWDTVIALFVEMGHRRILPTKATYGLVEKTLLRRLETDASAGLADVAIAMNHPGLTPDPLLFETLLRTAKNSGQAHLVPEVALQMQRMNIDPTAESRAILEENDVALGSIFVGEP